MGEGVRDTLRSPRAAAVLLVGILAAHDHFSIPAIAPLAWNLVIILSLVFLRGLFEGRNQIYAYAIGVLLGTIVQLAMVLPEMPNADSRLKEPSRPSAARSSVVDAHREPCPSQAPDGMAISRVDVLVRLVADHKR